MVTEFPTMESSRLIDNAGSIVLTPVKRTTVTGPTLTDQPQQRQRRPKARLMDILRITGTTQVNSALQSGLETWRIWPTSVNLPTEQYV